MKNCPVCGIDLKEIVYHQKNVDRCPQCKGMFFDQGELESLAGIADIYSRLELDEDDIDAQLPRERTDQLACPHCRTPMETQHLGPVEIEQCPSCRGFWLDQGEIVALKIAENHIRENLNLYIRLGK